MTAKHTMSKEHHDSKTSTRKSIQFRIVAVLYARRFYKMTRMAQQMIKSRTPDLEESILVATTLAKKGEFDSTEELLGALSGQMSRRNLENILAYLEKANMIIVDKNGGMNWIFSADKRIQKMHEEAERLL